MLLELDVVVVVVVLRARSVHFQPLSVNHLTS